MVAGLNPEMKELLQTQELLIIIDEAALLKWCSRDAISEMLAIVRNQPDALDGGATILEVSDPCQGLMELSKKEAEPFLRNGVLYREVYTDGAFMEDSRREKVFFTEVKRFTPPQGVAAVLQCQGNSGALIGRRCWPAARSLPLATKRCWQSAQLSLLLRQ